MIFAHKSIALFPQDTCLSCSIKSGALHILSMPDFVLQYDLSSLHITNNGHVPSTVYRHISRLLRQRGWTRHQYSCWRVEAKTLANGTNDANNIAAQMEARWGVGIFLHLEHQDRNGFIVTR